MSCLSCSCGCPSCPPTAWRTARGWAQRPPWWLPVPRCSGAARWVPRGDRNRNNCTGLSRAAPAVILGTCKCESARCAGHYAVVWCSATLRAYCPCAWSASCTTRLSPPSVPRLPLRSTPTGPVGGAAEQRHREAGREAAHQHERYVSRLTRMLPRRHAPAPFASTYPIHLMPGFLSTLLNPSAGPRPLLPSSCIPTAKPLSIPLAQSPRPRSLPACPPAPSHAPKSIIP